MKTPLRGEMLRGADFIVGVVSARGRDPLLHGARPASYFVHAGVGHAANISGDRTTTDPGKGRARRPCFGGCRPGSEGKQTPKC